MNRVYTIDDAFAAADVPGHWVAPTLTASGELPADITPTEAADVIAECYTLGVMCPDCGDGSLGMPQCGCDHPRGCGYGDALAMRAWGMCPGCKMGPLYAIGTMADGTDRRVVMCARCDDEAYHDYLDGKRETWLDFSNYDDDYPDAKHD